jgi:hypothetical protein
MTEGTGIWLLGNPELIEWKNNGGLLWLQGKGMFCESLPTSTLLIGFF